MVQVQKSETKAKKPKGGRIVGELGDGVVQMYAINTPGIERLKLPRGAFITVVATESKVARALERTGMLSTGSYRKVTSVRARSAPAIDSSAFEPDARARAVLRGREIAQHDLKAAGGAYNLNQVRTLLNNVTRQRIDRRVKEGTLLAIPGPSNTRRFPTFQFTTKGMLVEGLKEVQEALPTRNPWAILNFFVQPDERLDGRKPIDVLKSGDVAAVVSAAHGMAQAGG